MTRAKTGARVQEFKLSPNCAQIGPKLTRFEPNLEKLVSRQVRPLRGTFFTDQSLLFVPTCAQGSNVA